MLAGSKKAHAQKDILTIWHILQFAQGCYGRFKQLSMPQSNEEQEYLNKSYELKFIRYALWRLSVIELSKLYSPKERNDKFNIEKFISKLKKGNHYEKMGVSSIKIDEWENRINSKSQLIQGLLRLRDKVYAHTDEDMNHYNQDITYQGFEELITFIQDIISEIYLVLYNAEVDHSNAYSSRFSILKQLTNCEKLEIQQTKKEYGL